jgi:anaerobic magnesium-protoporphyrin IX monomethyl ester cyclase
MSAIGQSLCLVSGPQFYDEDPPSFPIGIGSLLGAANAQRIRTTFIDVAAGNSVSESIAAIGETGPTLIGVANVYTCTAKQTADLCHSIKQAFPNTPLVIGGVHATHVPENSLRDCRSDFVIRGEAEIALPRLVQAIAGGADYQQLPGITYTKDDQVVSNAVSPPIRNLDDLPQIPYDQISMEPYLEGSRETNLGRPFPIVTSRGCPFPCTYCSSGHFWGQTTRRRSVDHVEREIATLKDNFGVRVFDFQDDTFTISKKYTFELAKVLRDHHIWWMCETRADCVNDELLAAMKASGCFAIRVGIESTNPKTLEILQRRISYDRYREFFELAHQHSIRVRPSIMIGLPNETEENIRDSVETIEGLPFAGPVAAWTFTPIPGTKIFDQHAALKYQILENDYEQFTPFSAVIATQHLSKREIDRITFGTQLRLGLSRVRQSRRDLVAARSKRDRLAQKISLNGTTLAIGSDVQVFHAADQDFWKVQHAGPHLAGGKFLMGRKGDFYELSARASAVFATMFYGPDHGSNPVPHPCDPSTYFHIIDLLAILEDERLIVHCEYGGLNVLPSTLHSVASTLESQGDQSEPISISYLGSMFGD